MITSKAYNQFEIGFEYINGNIIQTPAGNFVEKSSSLIFFPFVDIAISSERRSLKT